MPHPEGLRFHTSRILRSLEERELHPDFRAGRFELVIAESSAESLVKSPEDPIPFAIRVFNADYVDENLSWERGVEPILVLGRQSQELQDRRVRVAGIIERIEDLLESLGQKKSALQRRLDDAATRRAGEVRTNLGITPFNRSPHLQKYLEEVLENPAAHVLTDQAYAQELSLYRAEARMPVDPIRQDWPIPLDKGTVDRLFRETAQQVVIESLRNNPGLEGWVEQGVGLHAKRDRCAFCDGRITEERLGVLSQHFSDSLRSLRKQLDLTISTAQDEHVILQLVDPARLFEDLRTPYTTLSQRAETCARRINAKLDALAQELEGKKSRVDETYAPATILNPSAYSLLISLTGQIGAIIMQHNERVDRIEKVKENAKERLLRHQAATLVRDLDWAGTLRAMDRLQARMAACQSRKSLLTGELDTIDQQISEEVLGAEKVNYYLKAFFGNEDIAIQVREDKRYSLVRSGTVARNLSEGERTAISFSYFLAQLEAKDVDLTQTLVYIDDPVSSLDANHVYNTFAVIKTVLADARQLFVSTHNYGFFKLLQGDSYFKEWEKKGSRRTSLYYIKRDGTRNAEIVPLPEMLKKYNSEYHYLFSVLYAFHLAPNENDAIVVSLPNLVRRVLEIYTSFRIPQTTITLDERLRRLCDDPVVAARIYKFVNHQSHSDSLSLSCEFPGSEECKGVIDAVLDMIRSGDPDHCDGMIKLCTGA
ncbi:MAG: AAA family ATPase, partial [Coriobacteriia bacterium]|nr:AAA family ATPase [Coriobacteriia bacterium]